MDQECTKEIYSKRVDIACAMLMASPDKKHAAEELQKDFNQYVSLMYDLEDIKKRQEEEMMKEYEKIRHLDVRFVSSKNGVKITGLEGWD